MTRTLVLLAAAVLAFDGAAVVALGVLTHRPIFMAVGLVLVVAAVATLLSWGRHRARLDEIRRDREELREQRHSLDRFIERH